MWALTSCGEADYQRIKMAPKGSNQMQQQRAGGDSDDDLSHKNHNGDNRPSDTRSQSPADVSDSNTYQTKAPHGGLLWKYSEPIHP